MTQMLVRLIFLLLDMIGNVYLLSLHHPFFLGSMQLDSASSLVAFNAIMILVVYIVDFVIVATQRLLIDIDIGEGFTNRKRR